MDMTKIVLLALARRGSKRILPFLAGAAALCGGAVAATVSNPFIHADIPDVSIVRVGGTFYMSHTTMHMTPGVPIMKSTDLVNWKTVGYCYQILANSDALNLANGKDAYGAGSWASSIRHKDGTFHVLVPSNTTGRTHLYTTKDAEKGPWKETILPFYHDPSLVLDDDGRNYVVYGQGDIKIAELAADLSGAKSGGLAKTILPQAHSVASTSVILGAEGSQVFKKDGYYYVFNICWPNGGGRTEICHRAKSLSGPWEGKVVLNSNGVAQGGVVDDAKGGWWGYLFQDNGAVGRSPWIMPVTWVDGWPVFNGGVAPKTLAMATDDATGTGFATSDDFNSASMRLEWQWNHNADKNWSLTARPGHYRIATGRVDGGILSARNTLTQRSFGPKCSGRIALDASGLKDGDVAGLAAFADSLGFVAVKNTGGALSVVKYKGSRQEASVAIAQKRVFLRVDMDFTNRTDKATFFYSLDSVSWKGIGNTLQMSYTLGMFMGYRFALFDYATKTAGGYADFDWFKVGAGVDQAIDIYPPSASVRPDRIHEAEGASLRFAAVVSGARRELSVRYELGREGRAEIYLATLRGRVLERVVDQRGVPGSHEARIATELPEGGYLLVARLDGVFQGARSIVLTE